MILTYFPWGSRLPGISLEMLYLPILAGGLALPSLQCYYLASQLTNIHWWFFPDLDFASVATEAALVQFYEALINVLYRNGPYPLVGAGMLKLSHNIFHLFNKRIGVPP